MSRAGLTVPEQQVEKWADEQGHLAPAGRRGPSRSGGRRHRSSEREESFASAGAVSYFFYDEKYQTRRLEGLKGKYKHSWTEQL